MSEKIEVGDWVRFYLNARLVIGKVEYITDGASWESGYNVNTDYGRVNSEQIIEVRKATR